MSILKEKDKKKLTEFFKRIEKEVTILYFTQEMECQLCEMTRNLLEDVAAFFPEGCEQRAVIRDPVVDHERRRAGAERLALGGGEDRPDRRPDRGLAVRVGPAKGRAAPVLDVDAEVPRVPGAHGVRVLGLEEDATDTSHALHGCLERGILLLSPDAVQEPRAYCGREWNRQGDRRILLPDRSRGGQSSTEGPTDVSRVVEP